MSFELGIIAALAAPFTMTIGFIVWDNHWAGSAFALNMFKCNLASIGFVVLSSATRSENPFSSEVFQFQSVGYLMLSSVIGIVIGDLTWLEGLRLLGPQRVIVMDSLKPFLAAVFGWALLGEELRVGALGGIVLTVVGILLVSLGPGGQDDSLEDEEILPTQEAGELNDNEAEIETRTADASPKMDNATALGDPSAPSLATGTFPQSTIISPVVVGKTDGIEIKNDDARDVSTISQLRENLANACKESPVAKTIPKEIEHQEEQSASSIPKQKALPRTNSTKRASNRLETQRGFAMAILNVVLDTYGSVLTKEHGAQFSTWEINLVRFGFAGLVMMVVSIFLQARDYFRCESALPAATTTDHDEETGEEGDEIDVDAEETLWYKLPLGSMTRSAWSHVCLGVLFVTFVTPALSNYALFQIALALALTLGSVGPLYALPLTYIMQKDQKRPTLRVCLGAAFAVAGIVVLAFWGTIE